MGFSRLVRTPLGAALVVALGALSSSAIGALDASSRADREPPALVLHADRSGRSAVQGALGQALDRAAQSKRPLAVPAGRYLVTSPVTVPVGVHLRLAMGALLTGAVPGNALLHLSARTTLQGGTLRNTSSADAFDVDLGAAARSVLIQGVRFEGDRVNAVYANNPGLAHLRVKNCLFKGVVYGVLLNSRAIDAAHLRITGNRFIDVSSDAVEINGATESTSQRVRDVRVVGNSMSGGHGLGDSSGFAVGMAGVDRFVIADNRITGVRSEAVHLENLSQHGVVKRNVVTGGGVGYRPAIAIYRSVADVEVRQNRIDHFRGPGIDVLWDPMGSASRIQVVANAIREVTADAIVVAGDRGTGPFTVLDNVVYRPGGHGVVVSGPHASTTVSRNILVGGRQPVVQTLLQGNGRRTYVDNRSLHQARQPFSAEVKRLHAVARP